MSNTTPSAHEPIRDVNRACRAYRSTVRAYEVVSDKRDQVLKLLGYVKGISETPSESMDLNEACENGELNTVYLLEQMAIKLEIAEASLAELLQHDEAIQTYLASAKAEAKR